MAINEKQTLKLLLIEDSPTDALLFRENVRSVVDVPFDVQHCDTLNSGIERLSEEQFDAVVLDLNLPDSSGLATFESLRRKQPATPIIILTGDDDRVIANQALLKGADNYLLKDSCDGNRIAVAILSAIRNRSMGVHTFTPPLRTVSNFEDA